ncbi:MAG: hypothetical protein JWM57_4032 [Phycisphaerales bacterium]|nr:hypothetical protein [Phycisphaerales bacterium]
MFRQITGIATALIAVVIASTARADVVLGVSPPLNGAAWTFTPYAAYYTDNAQQRPFTTPAVESLAGVAVGPDGNTYIATNGIGVGNVIVIDGRTGAFRRSISDPVYSPRYTQPGHLTVAPDGAVYVTSNHFDSVPGSINGVIGLNATAGGMTRVPINLGNTASTYAYNTFDVAVGPDGRVFASTGMGVVTSTLPGETPDFVAGRVFIAPGTGGLSYSGALTVGPDGDLYVASGSAVLRFSATTGAFIDNFIQPDTSFGTISDMAFDSAGDLLVVNATPTVSRFSGATGAKLTPFTVINTGVVISIATGALPEPASLGLIATCAAIGLRRVRKSRKE